MVEHSDRGYNVQSGAKHNKIYYLLNPIHSDLRNLTTVIIKNCLQNFEYQKLYTRLKEYLIHADKILMIINNDIPRFRKARIKLGIDTIFFHDISQIFGSKFGYHSADARNLFAGHEGIIVKKHE